MRRPVVCLLALAALATSCSDSPSRPPSQPTTPTADGTAAPPASSRPSATAPATLPDWPTYHGTADRAGFADVPALKPPLRRAWTVSLDAAVYAQPIAAAGNLIVATENNSV